MTILVEKTFSEASELVTTEQWMRIGIPFKLIVCLFYVFAWWSTATTRTTKASVAARARIYHWSVLWLVVSGVTHSYIEFFIAFMRDKWIDKTIDFYGAADFRYGRPLEEGAATVEAITCVILGPLCFITAYGFIHQTKWYHPVQLVLTTMQIYGCLWYFIHPFYTTKPEYASDPLLFWGIAMGMNIPWLVLPPMLWYKSFMALCGNKKHA